MMEDEINRIGIETMGVTPGPLGLAFARALLAAAYKREAMEAAQRAMLKSRFAGRRKSTPSADADLPAPNDQWEGS